MLPTAIWPSSRALEDLTMPQFARLLVFVPLIAVGLAHAQSADFSTLNCWGGETPEQCAVPRVPNANFVTRVTLGSAFGVARYNNGTIVCWGDNTFSQCTPPVLPALSTFAEVAVGTAHCVARIGPAGTIACWGFNGFSQTDVPSLGALTAVAVGAGQNHSLAILSDGSVIAWGLDDTGQVSLIPAFGSTPVSVSGGYGHSAALLTDGNIVCWGDNTFGQCDVPALGAETYTSVECGTSSTIALRSDGLVVAWGTNPALPGDDVTVIPPIPVGEVVVEAGGRFSNAYFRTDLGTIEVWGNNDAEQNLPPHMGPTIVTGVAIGLKFGIATLFADCDDNGIPDRTDVAVDPSLDCDQSGALDSCELVADPTLDCDADGLFDPCEIAADPTLDCDGNNRFDSCEIAALDTLDCDENAELDSCQIETDPTLDCDGNTVLDSCQADATGVSSNFISPFASGTTLTALGTGLALPIQDVRVEVVVKADLGSFGEWLELSLNDTIIDYMFVSGGHNCPSSADRETLLIDKDLFIALAPEGDVTITLRPTSFVNATECPSSNATLTATWRSAGADCNNNGTPDNCEVTTGDVSDNNSDGIPDTCEYIARQDLDADGMSDVIWWNEATKTQQVWFMDGDELREQRGITSQPSARSLLAFADLDGDANADLIYMNTTNKTLFGSLMDSTTVVEEKSISPDVIGSTVKLMGTPDLDGDGYADFVFVNSSTNSVTGWLMAGLTRRSAGTIKSSLGLKFVGFGDLDADGKTDLVWRDSTGRVRGWLMSGLTVTTDELCTNSPVRPSEQWKVMGMGDLDGDKKADILWRRISSSVTTAWMMDGLNRASNGTIDDAFGAETVIELVFDANGDMKSDLLWRNQTTSEVSIWLMDGLDSTSQQVLGTRGTAWTVIRR